MISLLEAACGVGIGHPCPSVAGVGVRLLSAGPLRVLPNCQLLVVGAPAAVRKIDDCVGPLQRIAWLRRKHGSLMSSSAQPHWDHLYGSATSYQNPAFLHVWFSTPALLAGAAAAFALGSSSLTVTALACW